MDKLECDICGKPGEIIVTVKGDLDEITLKAISKTYVFQIRCEDHNPSIMGIRALLHDISEPLTLGKDEDVR